MAMSGLVFRMSAESRCSQCCDGAATVAVERPDFLRLVSMVSISMMLQKWAHLVTTAGRTRSKKMYFSVTDTTNFDGHCLQSTSIIYDEQCQMCYISGYVTEANPHDCQSQRAVFPHSVKRVNIRSSNIKINTFSDAFLCNEHGKWDLMWDVVSLSQEQWAKTVIIAKLLKLKLFVWTLLGKGNILLLTLLNWELY